MNRLTCWPLFTTAGPLGLLLGTDIPVRLAVLVVPLRLACLPVSAGSPLRACPSSLGSLTRQSVPQGEQTEWLTDRETNCDSDCIGPAAAVVHPARAEDARRVARRYDGRGLAKLTAA